MIRLGYEIGNGDPVDIPSDRHIGVTGQTQMSGKTTTLEALVHRSKRRAVAFVTKRAENSFREAHNLPAYFRDSADWQFVSAILESMLGEKMKLQRSWIIDACRNARTLADVRANVKRQLHGVPNEAYTKYYALAKKERKGKAKPKHEWSLRPASGLSGSVLTELEAYLDIVIPQIEQLPRVDRLHLVNGLNVMDLSEYTTEMQGLVIRSVLEWVYEHERNTIVIIPEAWEFIPQNRKSPVLLAAEELIRKGAASGNYMWLDSQDIASIHTNVRRSVGTWIVGVQRESNEVKRTLGYAGAAATKLREQDIMTLTRGQFYAFYDRIGVKTYVQPFWVGDVHAQAIARGEEKLESAERIWKENRIATRAIGACPQCGGKIILSSHGPYCPDESCKWGWEVDVEPKRSAPAPPQMLQIQEQAPNEQELEMQQNFPVQPMIEVIADVATKQIVEDETMWKEKYEAFEKRVNLIFEELYQAGVRFSVGMDEEKLPLVLGIRITSPNAPVDGLNETAYEWLKARLLSDKPMLAALELARPTLRVTVTKPTLAIAEDSVQGRIALLIFEKFFAQPRPAYPDVLKEFKRRGWVNAKLKGGSVITNPLAKITEMGFLSLEPDGYQSVPGMKIEKAEA